MFSGSNWSWKIKILFQFARLGSGAGKNIFINNLCKNQIFSPFPRELCRKSRIPSSNAKMWDLTWFGKPFYAIFKTSSVSRQIPESFPGQVSPVGLHCLWQDPPAKIIIHIVTKKDKHVFKILTFLVHILCRFSFLSCPLFCLLLFLFFLLLILLFVFFFPVFHLSLLIHLRLVAVVREINMLVNVSCNIISIKLKRSNTKSFTFLLLDSAALKQKNIWFN